MEYINYKHCVIGANLHMQFTPAYRRDIFCDSVVLNVCLQTFYEIAKNLKVEILVCAFGPDHVHIFLSKWKNYAIPELAKRFKGASSRIIRRYFWNRIRVKLYGKKFWSEGYFAETVGRVTSESMRHYIEKQQGKHWKDSNYQVFQALSSEDVFQIKITEF